MRGANLLGGQGRTVGLNATSALVDSRPMSPYRGAYKARQPQIAIFVRHSQFPYWLKGDGLASSKELYRYYVVVRYRYKDEPLFLLLILDGLRQRQKQGAKRFKN